MADDAPRTLTPPSSTGFVANFQAWIARQDIAFLTKLTAGVNFCDAFWVCIAFPLGFGIGELSTDNLLNWLLLLYTMTFSMLLMVFHMPLGDATTVFLRRYFGFMFSWTGRFGFLVFLALMCFTANETWWYLIVVGIITVIVAVFNCCILCNHPAFLAGGRYEAIGVEGGAQNRATPSKPSTSSSSASAWDNTSDVESVKPTVSSATDNSPFGGDDAAPTTADVWDKMDDNSSDPSVPTGKRVVALYKFDADENDPEQISMKPDDVLTLIEKQADGWAKVVKDGKKGVVPVQYISEA